MGRVLGAEVRKGAAGQALQGLVGYRGESVNWGD